jgi:alpha-amylase/alpha-mannosidase (GH57 family)
MAEVALRNPVILNYYSEQFFADILVWYHLAWIGETVRNTDHRIKSLMKKSLHFSVHDRHLLTSVISELVSGVIGRYKELAVAGRIELSMTPYAHPIVPLLLDFKSAEQAIPDAKLPLSNAYPGGLERSQWHLEEGMAVFKKYFGFSPSGCWPSEGGISKKSIELISNAGFKWTASGETVLTNSLKKSGITDDECIHTVYQHQDNNTACFFRDDGLSDLIGFKYSDWHGDDAVANLISHLETIALNCQGQTGSIVSIILDGENAWEYYPENGYHFINALYEKLTEHEKLKLTTYSEYLQSHEDRRPLPEIVAGSWVYGTFSTWIGEKDKNRAWDMLVEAKITYDKVINEGILSDDELINVNKQLATCESSDWFWWVGEYNPAESVAEFDKQFRLHLSNLYQLMHVEPPEYLANAFSFGSGDPVMGGAMLPGQHQ